MKLAVTITILTIGSILVGSCARPLVKTVNDQPANSVSVPYHLPEGLIKVSIKPKREAGKGDSFDISISPIIYADKDMTYHASFPHSIFSNDKISITSKAGLLTSSDFTSTDESIEIVKKLAETAVNVAKAGVPATGMVETNFDSISPIELIIDPFDFDLASIDESVKPFYIEINRVDGVVNNTHSKNILRMPKEGIEGIYHRTPAIFNVEVKVDVEVTVDSTGVDGAKQKSKVTTRKPIASSIVMVPDIHSFELLPLKAGPFVTTKYEVSFEDGMLTKLTADRPSEVLGFMSLPLELSKTLVSVPGELLKLKIDYTNQQKDLLAAQKQLIETQRALAESTGQDVSQQPDPATTKSNVN